MVSQVYAVEHKDIIISRIFIGVSLPLNKFISLVGIQWNKFINLQLLLFYRQCN